MGDPRVSDGSPTPSEYSRMGPRRVVYGSQMGFPLFYSAGPWITHAFRVLAHGPVMNPLWISHGCRVLVHGFIVLARESPTDFPWVSHGINVLAHG